MSCRATYIEGREDFVRLQRPGSIWISDPDTETQEQYLWYYCPCGCGRRMVITIGRGFKPEGKPSWKWNGSIASPSLDPSVCILGHWHGWLKNGVWDGQ